MPEIEIGVKVATKGTDEIRKLETDFKRSLSNIEKAAHIEGDVDMDSSSVKRLEADFKDARAEARKLLDTAKEDINIHGRAQVDTSEIQRAEAMLRNLDDIPPPMVRPELESGSINEIEGAMSNISMGGMVDSMAGQLSSALSAGGPVGAAAGAAVAVMAATFGEDIAEGLSAGFNRNRNALTDAVKRGLEPAEARQIGMVAGDAYRSGFGESLDDLRETAGLLANTLSTVDSSLNLESATRQASALSQMFGVDMTSSIELARRLIANGLAPDTDQAFRMMGDAAQKWNLDIDDIMDVMNEFAPVFGKMGVDGAQAFNIIGTAVGEGLLPNVDRAAELFEEFNIEITDGMGRARPVVEKLGLSFEDMQAKLASGKGAEAMAEIATALLNVGDETERNQMAFDLFGTAIESASDPERVLELLAQADAVGEIGTAMDDAVAATEEQQSGFQELKRAATDLGSAWGTGLNAEIAVFMDLIKGHPLDAFGTAMRGVKDTFLDFTDALGITSEAEREVTDQFEANRQKAIENADAYDYNVSAQDELHQALGRTQTELGTTSESADGVTQAIADLDAEFAALQARFDGDAAVRNLYEELDKLGETSKDTEGDIYDLGTGFDTTTAQGRTNQAQMEQVSGALLTLAQGHRDGHVTALELARGQNAAEASLRQAAAQMGLTEAETQDLIDRYLQVPTDITTYVDEEGNALSKIEQVIVKLRGLDGLRTTSYVDTVQTTVYRSRVAGGNAYSRSGGVKAMAGGGTSGADGMVLVGEEGPELVRLGIGAQVYSTSDTDAIAMNTMGGQRRSLGSMTGGARNGGGEVHVHVYGSILRERELTGFISDSFDRGDFGSSSSRRGF